MSDRWYAGQANGQVVVIEGAGETLLAHHVRHSPDGFSWGYGGSGPAELARCLLIDALGNRARCGTCDGTGTVVYVGGEPMSVGRAEAEHEGDGWQDHAYNCAHCDDGITVEPATYQQFKFDVIAQLAVDQPWSMPRSQVLAWHEAYAQRKEQA
jgi:hypothetical protein